MRMTKYNLLIINKNTIIVLIIDFYNAFQEFQGCFKKQFK